MSLNTEVGLGPDDTIIHGTQLSPKRGALLHFLAHVCRGQTAGWIKIALGTKVGLGPGHIVLDGGLPPKKGHPLF